MKEKRTLPSYEEVKKSYDILMAIYLDEKYAFYKIQKDAFVIAMKSILMQVDLALEIEDIEAANNDGVDSVSVKQVEDLLKEHCILYEESEGPVDE